MRRSKHVFASILAFLSALAFVGTSGAQPPPPRPIIPCAAPPVGRFAFAYDGLLYAPVVRLPAAYKTADATPVAAAGILSFDAGTVTMTFYRRLASSPSTALTAQTLQGTYTVGGDCTVTAAFKGITFRLLPSQEGRPVWFVQTDPRAVVVGSAYKMPDLGTCSAATLNGTYAGVDRGWAVIADRKTQTIGNVYAFASVAFQIFDGNGGILRFPTLPYALFPPVTNAIVSFPDQEAESLKAAGSYMLDADCTGTTALVDLPGTLRFFLSASGEMTWIRTDSIYRPPISSGVWRKQ